VVNTATPLSSFAASSSQVFPPLPPLQAAAIVTPILPDAQPLSNIAETPPSQEQQEGEDEVGDENEENDAAEEQANTSVGSIFFNALQYFSSPSNKPPPEEEVVEEEGQEDGEEQEEHDPEHIQGSEVDQEPEEEEVPAASQLENFVLMFFKNT